MFPCRPDHITTPNRKMGSEPFRDYLVPTPLRDGRCTGRKCQLTFVFQLVATLTEKFKVFIDIVGSIMISMMYNPFISGCINKILTAPFAIPTFFLNPSPGFHEVCNSGFELRIFRSSLISSALTDSRVLYQTVFLPVSGCSLTISFSLPL